MSNSHNVSIVGEDLVSDGIDQVALAIAETSAEGIRTSIARKVQSYQVFLVKWFAIDRVLVGVFLKPCAYDFDVEDGAVGRTDGVFEGL